MIKVLYIAGWGRSGSTLLGNVLGELGGYLHLGETEWVWRHGLVNNYLCGCGLPFHQCVFWGAVFKEAFGGMDAVDGKRMDDLRWKEAPHNRQLLRSLISGKWEGQRVPEEVLGTLERLYVAVCGVSGAKVLVDSSKTPSYAYILQRMPNISLYLLHLIRDPRATAYSWMRDKERRDVHTGRVESMQKFSPYMSAIKWNVSNVLSEKVGYSSRVKYMRLRYEDFATTPAACLEQIMAFVGEAGAIPLGGSGEYEAGVHHTVWGNPARTRTGQVRIRRDDAWESGLGAGANAGVTLLASPLLGRYGYPFLSPALGGNR